MSGPKCHRVRVSAEVRRQRERQRLDDALAHRCKRLANELTSLAKQLPSGVAVPSTAPEPSSKSHEALVAWERDLKQAIDQAKGMVSSKAANDILQRLNLASRDVDVAGVGLGGRQEPGTGHVASGEGVLTRVSKDLALVAQSISELRDPAVRSALTELADQIRQIDSPEQAKGDLLTLKSKVSDAVRVQECRDQATEIVSELADIESDDADRLRQQALGTSTPAEVSSIRREVGALVDAMTADAEAAFVLDTLEEVLEELGFKLGEGFELSDFGAVTVAEHPDHPGFGLRFQLGSNNDELFTRVVALEASTPHDASQAEEDTCAKVFAVADGLRRAGIEAQLTSERLPGEAAVETVSGTENQGQAKTTRRRRRRTTGTKARER